MISSMFKYVNKTFFLCNSVDKIFGNIFFKKNISKSAVINLFKFELESKEFPGYDLIVVTFPSFQLGSGSEKFPRLELFGKREALQVAKEPVELLLVIKTIF